MKNIDDLPLLRVWVNAAHRADSAQILMRGHGMRAMAVLDGNSLLGVCTLDGVSQSPGDRPVGELLRNNPAIMSPRMSIVRAAQQFVDEDLDVAVVMDENEFYGLVSANMLLRELRRSWDPLTGLSYSDHLREWGIENLSAGREITILFVDLNSFGKYNKLYGHLVGDRVLRRVAALLKDSIEPKEDVLVRYGGDEFAIGTLRPRAEADQLAQLLLDRSETLFLEDSYKPVSFTIGVAGGRRSVIRPDIHVASTFDELLNAASRDMLSKKPTKPA